MDGPLRVPPRFVPTLTTVVDLEAEPAPVQVAAVPLPPAPASAVSSEGRDPLEVQLTPESIGARVFVDAGAPAVPVVHLEPDQGLDLGGKPERSAQGAPFEPLEFAPPSLEPPVAPASPVANLPEVPVSPGTTPHGFQAISPVYEADAFRLEEELLHRVLQRVDLSLEERLTEVVSATVQQQLDAMIPRLREGVEAVLRQLVVEAMAQELLENPGSATGSGASSLG